MGFWSNTAKVLSATGSAFNDGMEQLANFTSELERSAHCRLLESKIRLLESRRARLGDEWFESFNANQNQELLDIYAELIRDYPGESTTTARVQLDQLHADSRSVAVNRQVMVITELNDRVKSANYPLAIDAINVRKRLLGMLEELGRIASIDEEYGGLLEWSGTRIAELEYEIKDLESKRRTTEITTYPSGAKKTKIERFDGKLNGLYEQWYQNGKLCWIIPFTAGEIVGNVEHRREDGSCMFEGVFDKKLKSYSGFSVDSTLLLKAQIQQPNALIAEFYTDLEGVSFRRNLGTRFSKFEFVLKVLVNPKLMAYLWKARNPGVEADKLHEYWTLSEQINRDVEELLAIRKAG